MLAANMKALQLLALCVKKWSYFEAFKCSIIVLTSFLVFPVVEIMGFNHNIFDNIVLRQGGLVRTKWFWPDFQLLSARNCKSKHFIWPLTIVAVVYIWLWEQ